MKYFAVSIDLYINLHEDWVTPKSLLAVFDQRGHANLTLFTDKSLAERYAAEENLDYSTSNRPLPVFEVEYTYPEGRYSELFKPKPISIILHDGNVIDEGVYSLHIGERSVTTMTALKASLAHVDPQRFKDAISLINAQEPSRWALIKDHLLAKISKANLKSFGLKALYWGGMAASVLIMGFVTFTIYPAGGLGAYIWSTVAGLGLFFPIKNKIQRALTKKTTKEQYFYMLKYWITNVKDEIFKLNGQLSILRRETAPEILQERAFLKQFEKMLKEAPHSNFDQAGELVTGREVNRLRVARWQANALYDLNKLPTEQRRVSEKVLLAEAVTLGYCKIS